VAPVFRRKENGMNKQRGVGVLHILLIIVIALIGIGIWKNQQRKASTTVTVQQPQGKAELKSNEIALEQQLLAEINLKVEAAREKELEIQRRVYQSINKEPPVADQSDSMSKSLPYLPWKAIPIGMPRAEIQEFSNAATKFIISSLKDPDSAKFSDMKILKASHSDGSFTFICGRVNAKNSFGGYTGFQDFVVYRRETNMIEGGIGDQGSLAVVRSEGKWWSYDGDDMCLTYGFPIERFE
jgi:hypothetical protein